LEISNFYLISTNDFKLFVFNTNDLNKEPIVLSSTADITCMHAISENKVLLGNMKGEILSINLTAPALQRELKLKYYKKIYDILQVAE